MIRMDDCGNSPIKFVDNLSDLIPDSTAFFIWAIYKGTMVKVPNVDLHKRPALRFKQMDIILECEYKDKKCELSCPLQQGYQLRSSKATYLSSSVSHTLPSKADETYPNEAHKIGKDVNNDCSSNVDSVDSDDLVFSGLTLKEIQSICKARVRGVSVPNYSLESSGSSSSLDSFVYSCGNGRKRARLQKSEDDSDLHETLSSWREKVSNRRSKTRKRCPSPKQISFSMHAVPVQIKEENPTNLSSDGDIEVATVKLDQDVVSSISGCEPVASVSVEHLSVVEVKAEVSETYRSEPMNVIVDNQNQNYFCGQPLNLLDVATEGAIQNPGPHISTEKAPEIDVSGFYEECLKHHKSGNPIESSSDALPETYPESTVHASSPTSTSDIILEQEEISPLTIKNDAIEMHDAPSDVGYGCLEEIVSANDAFLSTVNSIDCNLTKSPEVSEINHVYCELTTVSLGEKATQELDAICTEQYCDIDVPDTGDFSAKLNGVEDLLECTTDQGLSSEFLGVQASTDVDNRPSPPHGLPDSGFHCSDLQKSKFTICEAADKSFEGLASVKDDNCGYSLMHAAKSEAKRDASELFFDRNTKSAPRKLFAKRKVISPTSQEKLCQAMDAEELYNVSPAEKRRQRMLFDRTRIASPVVGSDDVETAPEAATKTAAISFYPTNDVAASFNGDSHLPSTHKSLSPPSVTKGILKSSCGPCIVSCNCSECISIRLYAQKAIDFSQRQMHDIECLTSKLLRQLKSLKSIVEDNLISETCLLTVNNRVDEVKNATSSASEVEETTRRWLYMMSRDCNRFCKIMKIKEKKPVKAGCMQREQKRITFADEAGGLLCHVKVFHDDSAPLFEHEKAEAAYAE